MALYYDKTSEAGLHLQSSPMNIPDFTDSELWAVRSTLKERYGKEVEPQLAEQQVGQPVEHAMALRAIPNLWVFRPADANETAIGWKVALERRGGPVALLLSRPDTRVLAGEWIEREIPNGARIAVEPYSPAIRLSPAMVRTERQRLGDTVAAQIARHRFDQFLARSAGQAEQGYWLFRLNAYDLGWLAERRVEYVVLSGFTYQRYQRACDRYPEACRFYAELERRGTLVYAIEPGTNGQALWVGDIYSPLTRLSERTRPGPPIKIYRLPTAN